MVSYSKNLQDIPICITNRTTEDGILSGIATSAEVSLAEKLKDYMLRFGYSSAHITGIVVQLLTKGKVRVDFRDYMERIELINSSDQMSSSQAMGLLEKFIQENITSEDSESGTLKLTQKINVQLPKLRGR